MRNILLPLLTILVFTSCQKQIPSEKVLEELSRVAAKKPAEKMVVCHYDAENNTWHIINISINAWPEHQTHGDVRLDDQDGDGYMPNNACGFGQMGDCNDNDAAINPDATEICGNNIDDNCNGQMDENCIPTVTICDQVWMLNNLDVTKYRNGDDIPQVSTNAEWMTAGTAGTGAWCYYANNSANGTTYGKLYNWYAVNDPRGLAPAGWHVPTDAEWTVLSECLGGSSVAGGKMKETGIAHWSIPNTDATNSSGFTGLPGGSCDVIGTFYNVGIFGIWWSSTESSTNGAWNFSLNYGNGFLSRNGNIKRLGLSVRCIKD